ncbi:MAG: hypothetical protein DRP22_01385, partial [Verrucomicrobia bacterium]
IGVVGISQFNLIEDLIVARDEAGICAIQIYRIGEGIRRIDQLRGGGTTRRQYSLLWMIEKVEPSVPRPCKIDVCQHLTRKKRNNQRHADKECATGPHLIRIPAFPFVPL